VAPFGQQLFAEEVDAVSQVWIGGFTSVLGWQFHANLDAVHQRPAHGYDELFVHNIQVLTHFLFNSGLI